MKPVISVTGLSKQYTLGSEFITRQSFREMLFSSLKAPFQKFKRLRGTDETQTKFWALKDISFEAHKGEIIGVIGRNGAGKSTLLKILSRITTPTTGKIEYHGRLASLLEVGTGFHPELTGRENIFLNGAILGLSRKEISDKLDDIVAFAEIDAFLDTPVKRYSSGMYVRLAFSVAAHLEADILVVDEVLAVGDSAFQKKCLGKIQDIASGGRTVFFVSHNTAAVARLCTRGIWLDKGVIKMDDNIQSVLNAYDTSTFTQVGTTISSNSNVSIQSLSVSQTDGGEKNQLTPNCACTIELLGESHIALSNAHISLGLYGDIGKRLCLLDSSNSNFKLQQELGNFKAHCKIDALTLTAGRYSFNLSITQGSELLIGIERASVIYLKEVPSDHSTRTDFGPLHLNANWH